MDERLKKALDFSNYMITLNNQKRVLKEKYKENIIHYHAGGQFTVTKDLVTFVNMLVEKDNSEDIVLIDDNDTPIMIKDLDEFLSNIIDVYFSSVNEYHAEYEKIKRNRSVEKLVEYE